MEEKSTKLRFHKLRLQACQTWPYAATAILSLVPVEKPGFGRLECDKHWRIYYDPQHLETESPEVLLSSFLTCLLRLLRGHVNRFENLCGFSTDKTPELAAQEYRDRWQIATDIEIADDLAGEGFTLREGTLLPSDFELEDGDLAEAYFREIKLPEPPPSGGGGGQGDPNSENSEPQDGEGNGNPQDGEGDQSSGSGQASQDQNQQSQGGSSAADGIPRDWESPSDPNSGGESDQEKDGSQKLQPQPTLSEAEQQQIREQVADKILKCSQRGDVPNFLKRWADDLKNPKVNYSQLLRRKIKYAFEHVRGSSDYTFRRIHRRTMELGSEYSLPGLHAPNPRVSVVIDTSGSVSEDELSLFLTELGGVIRSLPRRDGVTVLCADAQVHTVARITNVKDLDIRGGGGTCMDVAIVEAAKRRPRPQIVICFTDGVTPWPKQPIGIPTIAIISRSANSQFKVPEWMDAVYLNLESA